MNRSSAFASPISLFAPRIGRFFPSSSTCTGIRYRSAPVATISSPASDTKKMAGSDITRVPGPRFSSTVIHSRVVYLAGQVSHTYKTDSVTLQSEDILAKIDQLLSDAGTDKSRLLSASVFLRDIGKDFDEFNSVWDAWIDKSAMPVRATIGSGLVGNDFSVEVQALAALPDRSGPVKTALAAAAVGPYNQGIISKNGTTLYVSGCIGLQPSDGAMAGDSLEAQSKQALNNLKEIIEAAGGTVSDIVKTTILLKNIEDYKEFNDIYTEFLKDVPVVPARSAFAVKALPKDALIEVEAIAELA